MTPNDKVRKEASRWFARRLDPATHDAEYEAFERWRDADPRRAAAYVASGRVWDKLAILKQSERLRRAAADSAASRGTPVWRNQTVRYPVLFGLASVLVVVTLTLVKLTPDHDDPVQTFATAQGEQRTERLTDGTALRLNTESTVDVKMNHLRREIKLRSGEAVFDVAKDVSRPFVVSAGDGTVTAVGTQFQVRNIAGAVAVTLMAGRVQVTRASRRETESLVPGQQATYSGSASGIVTRNVDVGALTGWMSGRLEFRNVPLEEAVAEANRYSPRKLRIGDSAISRLPISGTFRTGDVDGIATAFEAAFAIRVQSTGPDVVLYGQ